MKEVSAMDNSVDLRKISPEKVHQKLINAEKFVLIDTLTEDHLRINPFF